MSAIWGQSCLTTMIRAPGPSLSWVVPPHGIVVPIGCVDPILPSGGLWETIGGVMVADPIGLNSSGQAADKMVPYGLETCRHSMS